VWNLIVGKYAVPFVRKWRKDTGKFNKGANKKEISIILLSTH
jgi:hypothetical protein